MVTRDEIAKYTHEKCAKMTYYEIIEALIDEIYNHDITRNTLSLTIDKLEASRKIVKKLRSKNNDNRN